MGLANLSGATSRVESTSLISKFSNFLMGTLIATATPNFEPLILMSFSFKCNLFYIRIQKIFELFFFFHSFDGG
jgi:hypothetical protein